MQLVSVVSIALAAVFISSPIVHGSPRIIDEHETPIEKRPYLDYGLPWIIDGHETTIEKRPYQVSLQFYSKHICGGSIISETFVLTAAHCSKYTSDGQFIYPFWMRYGSTAYDKGGHYIKVIKWSNHPLWNREKAINDIALAQVEEKILLGSSAAIISLPQCESEDPDIDSMTTVSGWGVTVTNGSTPKNLREVDIPVYDHDICRRFYSHYGANITKTHLCLGGMTAGEIKGVCGGDSGGPAVKDGVQYGIVSFALDICELPSVPKVFTRVSSYYNWIMETMNNGNQCIH